jgi:hypothetical protein
MQEEKLKEFRLVVTEENEDLIVNILRLVMNSTSITVKLWSVTDYTEPPVK